MALANINVSSGGGSKTPKLLSVPVQSGTLTYSGSAKSPTWNGYDATQLTISGTTSATNAGTYTATFTLKDGYTWADGTSNPRQVTWIIAKMSVSVPTVTDTEFIYDGDSHAPTIGPYDSNLITVTNNNSSHAGSYSVIFKLKGGTTNFQWDDGTTANKTVDWTIAKAESVLSFDLARLVAPPKKTMTLNINKIGNGTKAVTSSNPSVAGVSFDQKGSVYVDLISEGTTTITVSIEETDDYTAASVTLPVKCKNPVAITDSWETISARSRSGVAANYYDVGDWKEITLNGKVGNNLTLTNETLRVFILHFNYELNGTADNNIIWGGFKNADGVDVALCDSLYNTTSTDGTICFNMNHTGQTTDETADGYLGTNYGGWRGSDLRYDILGTHKTTPPTQYLELKSEENSTSGIVGIYGISNPKEETLLAALPSDFRNVLRPWSRWIDAKGGTANSETDIKETIDAVTLLTEFEVFGTCHYANENEPRHQKQMDYYRWDNSKIKHRHTKASSATTWLLASPDRTNAYSFCCVSSIGRAAHTNACNASCVAPAFKT